MTYMICTICFLVGVIVRLLMLSREEAKAHKAQRLQLLEELDQCMFSYTLLQHQHIDLQERESKMQELKSAIRNSSGSEPYSGEVE